MAIPVFVVVVATSACGTSNGADVTSVPAPPVTAAAAGSSQPASGGDTAAIAASGGSQPAQASLPPGLATDGASPTAVPPPAAGGAVPYDTNLYYETGYAGRSYLCQRKPSIDTCAIYLGGNAPAIATPDLYCDPIAGRCTEYDPSSYVEVSYSGVSYLCTRNVIRSGYDCVTYFGGPAPSFFNADLFCSGLVGPSECSTLWYPNELSQYDFVTIDGGDFLCREAFTGRGGDADCYFYDGGDPTLQASGLADLYCSDGSGGFSCNREYYPSEWEGFDLIQIDFADYVCTAGFGGQECFRWYGTGTPSTAASGLPDFYCNARGCSPDGYP